MEGVFFAKFDDIAGPIVVCQAPRGKEACLGGDLFDRVSDYVIAKKELCGSLLTVSDGFSGKKVMSCPLFVENEKLYRRNAFFFAFGMVFQEDAQTGPFSNVLKKLALVMKSLEIESLFLSQVGAEKKILEILHRVVNELSKWGECIVSIDDANTLALKITPRLIDPPEVFDFQVPVKVRELDDFVSKEWDLTILQVMHFIDGERHIKLIAELSGVAVALVRRCVRQLLYFRCIRLVDIFQYSNTYTCTARIAELAENERLQRNCVKYVWTGHGEPPQLARLFQLYSSLQPCLAFKDFCLLFDTASLNIDDRRFVTFGVLHGIIRRVHAYPIFPPSAESEKLQGPDAFELYFTSLCRSVQDEDKTIYPSHSSLSLSKVMSGEPAGEEDEIDDDPGLLPSLVTLVNGRNSYDAICTELWVPAAELDAILRHHASICVVHK